MSSVVLSDLPILTNAIDGDIMLIRHGLTDYQINVTAIRAINLSTYSQIPYAQASDLMFIQRVGDQTYSARFNQIGFVKGTMMWFYANTASAPSGWQLVPNTGDALLACSDDSSKGGYNGVKPKNAQIQSGNWQQTDYSLTLLQIPPHFHVCNIGQNVDPHHKGTLFKNALGAPEQAPVNMNTNSEGGSGGSAQGHNHGNTWRPFANVGGIYQKMA